MLVPVLGAPVPLLAEQLVDVLALLEKKQEQEEEARMDRLEDMILERKSASVADMEAWRRWAKAGGKKRIRKKKRKKKLPKTTTVGTLRHAARVPLVQVRGHGGASVPLHRQSVLAIPVVTQRRGTHSAKLCRSPWSFCSTALGQGCGRVPAIRAVFQPLDDSQLSRALEVALTPGVQIPGVRPPVLRELVAGVTFLQDRSCVDRHMRQRRVQNPQQQQDQHQHQHRHRHRHRHQHQHQHQHQPKHQHKHRHQHQPQQQQQQ